ncbi:hypothetical protein [Micrococcoides hystricis]|uniref:ABC transporter permease n=1 Tax=Micrococcoides hystricis TaxID=1572761 RepID=A0ABV6PAK0_9MICC
MSDFSVRATRRYLNRHAFRLKDRLYVVYLVGILGLFWGLPGLFSVAGVLEIFDWSATEAAQAGVVVAGASIVAAGLLPLPLALPYTGHREFFFLIRGAGTKAALTTRTFIVVGVAAGLGALLGGILAASSRGEPPQNLLFLLIILGAGAGLTTAACSLLIQAKTNYVGRLAPLLIGLGLAATGLLADTVLLEFLALAAWVLLLGGLMLTAAVPSLLATIQFGHLDEITQRRKVLLSGLFTQNTDVATAVMYRVPKRFRGLRIAPPRNALGQGSWAAWLTLLRTPYRTLALLVAVTILGASIAWAQNNVLIAALVAAILGYVLTALGQSLSTRITALSGDGQERPQVFASLLGHALPPGLLCAAVFVVPSLIIGLFGEPVPSVGLRSALALAVLTMFLLAGSATTPVGVFTPVITPLGDASAVNWVLWSLRGFLPAAAWAVAVVWLGQGMGTAVALGGLALVVALRMIRLRRSVVTGAR